MYMYIYITTPSSIYISGQLATTTTSNKQATSTSQKQKPRHSQLVCRNPANSFLMESPSGVLNGNANGGSQLSAGGAGRWREVEKCGFHVTSPKMDFLDLIFMHNLSWCKIGPFCPGDLLM